VRLKQNGKLLSSALRRNTAVGNSADVKRARRALQPYAENALRFGPSDAFLLTVRGS
jgi:hypothetical protein